MNINFEIPGFENVEIKCKTGNKEDKEDTAYFLNELSIAYDYAAKFMQGQGMEAMAKGFDEKGKIIFEMLLQQGIYDKK